MSDSMDILGSHGSRLIDIAAPLIDGDPDTVDNESVGQERFFDGIAVLGDRMSPELSVWQADKLGPRLRNQGGTVWTPPGCARLFPASRAEDAQWMIRLQSIFLPVSSVLLRGETYVTASWHPTRFGTSRVYITHQDEPGVWRRYASLSGLLADTVADDEALEIEESTRDAYRAAVCAMNEADTEGFPEHLDPEKLQHRTRWIGELLIGQHVSLFDASNGLYYDRLKGIPTFETYAAERHLIAEWPHLQAYWMVHHTLLRNTEALADVMQLADDRYPPMAELRVIAEAFAVGNEPRQLVQFGPHQSLRWDVVKNQLGAMSPAARAEVQAQLDARDTLLATAASTLATLGSRTDEATIDGLQTWKLLCSCAGELSAAETQLLEVIVPDKIERDRMRMRVTTRDTTPFVGVFHKLMRDVDADWAPLFEAAFTAGATVHEDHADAAPGALVGWGKALGSFEALIERFDDVCKSAGHRRYLELAMVANEYPEEEASLPFLVSEMNDFLGDLGDWERSTTSFAFFALVQRKHAEALEAAHAVLSQGPMNGATWQTLLALVQRVEQWGIQELVPSLQALVERDYGRHDDGTRGIAMGTWARMAGLDAVAPLEAMLANISDVRKTCEEAQVIAGLLTAQAEHDGARHRAAGCVRELLERGGAMERGAAWVLLEAMDQAGMQEAVVLRASHPDHEA